MANTNFLYSTTRLLLVYTLGWLVFGVLHAIAVHRLGFSWELAAIDSVVANGLLALFGAAVMLIYKFYQPGSSNWYYRLGFVLALIPLYQLALNYTFKLLIITDATFLSFIEKSQPVRFIIALLILTFITAINWLIYYLNAKKESERNQTEIEMMMRDAELLKLRQQIQPHFLFNSLNSINALVITQPQEARKMVQQLSEFLRGTLKKDEQTFIAFGEELKHLQLYLDIEKVRFGHRLNIEIENCEKCLDALTPPLLLQPVVENAVKFGLYDTTGDVKISIHSKLENGYLTIEVTNPFDEKTQVSKKGNSFGLDSIHRRLYLLFARKDLLKTKQENSIFITTISIPQ